MSSDSADLSNLLFQKIPSEKLSKYFKQFGSSSGLTEDRVWMLFLSSADFSKLTFSKNSFRNTYSVKRFGSGSKQFSKITSRQQKLPLAGKELNHLLPGVPSKADVGRFTHVYLFFCDYIPQGLT